MTNDQCFKILLIEDDPIFLLGLRTFVAQFSELEVVAQAQTADSALQKLAELKDLDLVILDVSLARSEPEAISIPLIEQLLTQYPSLSVLLLGSLNSQELAPNYLMQSGIKGYCPKGTDPLIIVEAIRQIVAGQSYWGVQKGLEESERIEKPIKNSYLDREETTRFSQKFSRGRQFAILRQNLRGSGNRQIDEQVTQIDAQLQDPTLSALDQFFLLGRRRELLAARWMVNWLLGGSSFIIDDSQYIRDAGEKISDNPSDPSLSRGREQQTRNTSSGSKTHSGGNDRKTPDLQRSPLTSELSFKDLQSQLFETILAKLWSRLANLTDMELEIDILRLEKKQQLLYIILRKLEEILDELRFSQIMPSALPGKCENILQDLWHNTTTEFFGKYSTLQEGDRELELVPFLLQDAQIVQQSILNQIPLVKELFAYLLFQTPFIMQNVSYPSGSSEANQQAEILLENLLIQVANAVIQPLLNQFGNVEVIKYNFYDRQWMSTREIERFRNNLSWKYRIKKYWVEPKAIFESKYWLLVLEDRGIIKISIYSPRSAELNELDGVQQTVTLMLESRDAIAPRIRSLLVVVGSGASYLLMQLGRGIGFIARGVLQGIGSSFPDSRVGKK